MVGWVIVVWSGWFLVRWKACCVYYKLSKFQENPTVGTILNSGPKWATWTGILRQLAARLRQQFRYRNVHCRFLRKCVRKHSECRPSIPKPSDGLVLDVGGSIWVSEGLDADVRRNFEIYENLREFVRGPHVAIRNPYEWPNGTSRLSSIVRRCVWPRYVDTVIRLPNYESYEWVFGKSRSESVSDRSGYAFPISTIFPTSPG